jgi:hypothetical protein
MAQGRKIGEGRLNRRPNEYHGSHVFRLAYSVHRLIQRPLLAAGRLTIAEYEISNEERHLTAYRLINFERNECHARIINELQLRVATF